MWPKCNYFFFVKTNQFSVHSATVILCLEKQGLIPSSWFWIEIIQKIVEYFSRFTDSMKNRECSLSQNVWLCVTGDFCHNISDYWIFLSDWWPAPAPAPSCGWENTSQCLYAAIIVRYEINQMHWKMVYGMRIVIHISALFHSQQQNTPFYEKKKRSNKIKWIKSGFVSKSWKPKKVIHSLSLEFARLTTAGPLSWSGSISSYLKCQQNFSSLVLKPHTCGVSTAATAAANRKINATAQ